MTFWASSGLMELVGRQANLVQQDGYLPGLGSGNLLFHGGGAIDRVAAVQRAPELLARDLQLLAQDLPEAIRAGALAARVGDVGREHLATLEDLFKDAVRGPVA